MPFWRRRYPPAEILGAPCHGTLLGDGNFQADASNIPLNAPIVGMAVDPSTGGYWLRGKDGGVFSYGAPFYGSTGAIHLNQPVIGMSGS